MARIPKYLNNVEHFRNHELSNPDKLYHLPVNNHNVVHFPIYND